MIVRGAAGLGQPTRNGGDARWHSSSRSTRAPPARARSCSMHKARSARWRSRSSDRSFRSRDGSSTIRPRSGRRSRASCTKRSPRRSCRRATSRPSASPTSARRRSCGSAARGARCAGDRVAGPAHGAAVRRASRSRQGGAHRRARPAWCSTPTSPARSSSGCSTTSRRRVRARRAASSPSAPSTAGWCGISPAAPRM